MEEVAGLAMSAAGGGLVGLAGTALGRIFGVVEARVRRKDRELEMAHEKDKWDHEAELLAAQLEARKVETELAVMVEDARGSWKGLAASIDAEAKIGPSYPWVDAVRALTRPALTVLLVVILFIAWLSNGLTIDQRSSLMNALIFAATTSIVWWFGDRSPRSASSS